MTDILDIADSDNSENDDINRLFPRCKPKAASDINLNKHREDAPTLLQLEKNGNEKLEENGMSDPGDYIIDSQKDESYEEDRSVVSAYGMFGINCAEEHKDDGSKSPPLEMNSFQEFKLRESRIEIAGGREVYSTNRIRQTRKRVNDETTNLNVSLPEGKDEDKKGNMNSKYRVEAKIETDMTSKKHTCHYYEKKPEAIVYETQIDGSEVIYDDIGDWAQLKMMEDSINSFSKQLSINNELSSEEEDSSLTMTCANGKEDEILEKVTSLIGSLQIAEYEGSPRRYGPRPGHPERIVQETIEDGMQMIFKSEMNEEMMDEGEFNAPVLDKYNKDSSSYVGRRLAHFQTSCIEESPKKSINELENRRNYSDCYSDTTLPMDDCLIKSQLMDKVLLSVLDEDHESISSNPDTEDLAETEMGEQVGQSRNFTLSPETTDCDSNDVESEVSYENEESIPSDHLCSSMPVLEDGLSSGQASDVDDTEGELADERTEIDNPTALLIKKQISQIEKEISKRATRKNASESCEMKEVIYAEATNDVNVDFLDPLCQQAIYKQGSVDDVIKEIKQAILKTKTLKTSSTEVCAESEMPVWLPRPLYNQQKLMDDANGTIKVHRNEDGLEEDCDTDQETDRLLGKQRTDDKGYYEEKGWSKESTLVMSNCTAGGEEIESLHESSDVDKNKSRKDKDHRKKGRSKEVLIHEPAVLIEGVLFRARYLGSTQLVCEGQPTKATRMMQAEEAVSRIKAPEGENQPSTEVDLFISTEKIMVLNTDLKEIMMDHSLRTISYIADIGDLVVLMARRRLMNCTDDQEPKIRRTPKMICHVFESEEAQFIAQSIGQAFQVAYMEFLKANGIEDQSFVKEMDYQEVLNSQEIYGDELEMFAKKEMQKEVIVPKARGEMLGVVIVESGWGSMLPTVVIANLSPSGAAARCGQLNIGDQIIAINGVSLVGLPLSTCQNYIKNGKAQMVVKLTVVPCAPVVEVKIKRPDTKYQLGFSVQNGVICSLLRGGIAERGGVRVGHRIIEINGQSVVAVPHERIVNLLATSVGEILMKTMPTSMFRLLTGQETPVYI